MRALSSVATLERPLTADGAILGTFQYMAPEQLEGGDVDARTDIFAFGALLYEILTGRKAFHGKSQASLIAAILERQPESISSVQPMTPPELDRLMQRCLAKDADERWQNAFDLAAELLWIANAEPTRASRAPGKGRGTVAALLLGAMVAGLGTWASVRSPTSDARHPLRFRLAFSEDIRMPPGSRRPFAISPDGRWLVHVARRLELGNQLYLRPLDQFESRLIPGTDGASSPFFSPDARFVAFWAAGTLFKVPVEGGPPQPICEMANHQLSEWAEDDRIYWGGASRGLHRVSASGGDPETLTVVDSATGELGHLWPHLLPDGDQLMFTIRRSDWYETEVLSLSTGKRKKLATLGHASNARYLPSGHLLYADTNKLIAVPFDADSIETVGAAVVVLTDVQIRPGVGSAQLTVSRDGTLLYKPGVVIEAALFSVERSGEATQLFEDTDFFHHPRLSPDGTSLLVSIHASSGGHDLWLYDRARETRRRLTAAGDNTSPAWAPEGEQLAFGSVADEGVSHLSLIGTGGGAEVEILSSSRDDNLHPTSWSPDGRFVAYNRVPPLADSDIWIHEIDSDDGEASFLDSEFNERTPAFSSDGRWVAYVSDESGRNEIYIISFPGKERQIAISKGGGQEPLWSSNGRELFYRDLSGTGVYAVAIEGSEFGEPRLLFEGDYAVYPGTNYDVSYDGQSFIMVREIVRPSLNVVVNWFDELNERVPRK